MKYRNAQDIFPEALLRQIQRYVAGETIYIPAGSDRKSWGETSGYQQYIRERNAEIRKKFNQGSSFDELMEVYALEKLDVWIHLYLNEDGRNIPFSDGLKLFDRYYIGPIKMPIHLFTRCAGPEPEMKYRIHPGWFAEHVARLEKSIREDPDMPPLIVHYADSGFELNDGNHRHQAYQNLGIEEASVIVWITEPCEYEEFLSQYGQYAKDAPVIRR